MVKSQYVCLWWSAHRYSVIHVKAGKQDRLPPVRLGFIGYVRCRIVNATDNCRFLSSEMKTIQ